MLLKYFTSLALAGLAIAQTLTDVISRNPNLSTLGQLVAQYPSIASVLSNATNVTILAPTNAAFTSFLNQPGMNQSISADPNLVQAVLSYHVLQGVFRSTSITSTPAFARTLLMAGYYANVTGGQVVQAVNSGGTVTFTSGLLRQSRVSQADVTFNGGVVHVIDSVLTLPASPGATAAGANLTALAGALNTAGLVGTVNSLSDVTVFAPNNNAFANIQNLVSSLGTQQLTSILSYHVVRGTVGYSTLLTNGATLPTVQGSSVRVTVEGDGDIFVNTAKVVVANVLLSNGVAHVIDNVLNPSNTTVTPTGSATTGLPAFSGASSGPNVPFTSGITATGTAIATTGSTAAVAGVVKQTAAVGAAALFGGAAFLANY